MKMKGYGMENKRLSNFPTLRQSFKFKAPHVPYLGGVGLDIDRCIIIPVTSARKNNYFSRTTKIDELSIGFFPGLDVMPYPTTPSTRWQVCWTKLKGDMPFVSTDDLNEMDWLP